MGVADPDRLGVGGWSYGGILTDHVITKTTRFKAAVTGASEVQLSSPTTAPTTTSTSGRWSSGCRGRTASAGCGISPFFQVEKVATPTLVLCGAADMNVPLINSEQLYQALRRLGRRDRARDLSRPVARDPTPSYQKDRYERYLAWYDRFLRPGVVTAARAGSGAEAASRRRRRSSACRSIRPPLAPERQKTLEADLAKRDRRLR